MENRQAAAAEQSAEEEKDEEYFELSPAVTVKNEDFSLTLINTV